MFICVDCEAVFNEPTIVIETHGLPCPPYEHFAVCPHCKSTNIEEAKLCSRCDTYVLELEDGLCECCYGDLYGE